jgi:NAD(P)-dependent dehydrogenase (short-subunit alcohol dehydrogenase family)
MSKNDASSLAAARAMIAAQEASVRGKVVVITGATAGIGKSAAERLAGLGARIVMVARDQGRADQALAPLRAIAPNAAHCAYYADLSLLGEVKRVGAEIASAEPRIDVLVNNAGGFFPTRKITAEGIERTFALNHMAYFVLTHCLRERLLAAAPARIISTASVAHLPRVIDFDDLQTSKRYGLLVAYGRSKLCNILFTRELSRRWAGTGITVNCLHPGFVASRFGKESGGLLPLVLRAAQVFAISPEEGAETIVYLASSQEVADVSGRYFYKCRASATAVQAEDDSAARRLWQESAKLAGIA